MSIRFAAKRWLVPATLALTVGCLVLAPRAFARLIGNTIDTTATITHNGRLLVVTGPVQCSQTEWVDMRVTVTQRSTGAVAEGSTRLLGSADVQQWTVIAPTQGGPSFEEGPARAVAMAVTSLNGDVTDAHQWLVDITLVPAD